MPKSGILLLNKPVDVRSTACVQKVRSILGRRTKIGHGGTLDSTASGLLIVLVEKATRLSDFVMTMPKCYETTAQFGSATLTDDASGEVIKEAPYNDVDNAAIDSALCGFSGWIMQSPPAVSAVHVDGVRSHTLARNGFAELPPAKPVYIKRVSRISDMRDGAVNLRIECSKGTYVRSIVRDLGAALNSCAHVCALKRTSCGPFDISQALDASMLEDISAPSLEEHIIPMETLHKYFHCFKADEGNFNTLSHGQGVLLSKLRVPDVGMNFSMGGKIIVASEKIFSICTARKNNGTFFLSPDVNIIIDGGSGK